MGRLWLDAHDYGVRLLRGGSEPWLAPATLGPFYGELAALLQPHRLIVPVAPLLRANLGDERDAAAALDRVAQSHGLARSLETGLATLAHGACAGLLVLMLPGPAALGCDPEDEDALDDGVAALAQVLRALLDTALSGTILIDESEAAARAALGPLHRIAEHCGVDLRLMGEGLDMVAWDALERLAAERDTQITIPADSEPEAVLAQLAALRTAEREG
jgi:hypothetical protein